MLLMILPMSSPERIIIQKRILLLKKKRKQERNIVSRHRLRASGAGAVGPALWSSVAKHGEGMPCTLPTKQNRYSPRMASDSLACTVLRCGASHMTSELGRSSCRLQQVVKATKPCKSRLCSVQRTAVNGLLRAMQALESFKASADLAIGHLLVWSNRTCQAMPKGLCLHRPAAAFSGARCRTVSLCCGFHLLTIIPEFRRR